MDHNLQILGLAKKAGLIATGYEDVNAAARVGQAKLVISACDASESSLRRAQKSADTGNSLYVVAPYMAYEIGNMVGQRSPGMVAILNTGLAARFLRGLAQDDPLIYSSAAELMSKKARIQEESKGNGQSGKRRTML